MRLAILVAALAALSACAHPPPAPPEAIETGNSMRGLTFARQNCASCHAVAGGEIWSPNLSAPSFQAIANTPGMSARAVNVWLVSDHPSMPNLIVTTENGDDLWAYMQSLRTR